MLIEVAVAVSGIDNTLVYSINVDFEALSYVIVPFRNKEVLGIIIGTVEEIDFSIDKVKEVSELLHIAQLSRENLDFLFWICQYNMLNKGNVLKMAFPIPLERLKNISNSQCTKKTHCSEMYNIDLSDDQQKSYEYICNLIGNFNVVLLDGVTGSGKTSVFCKVANKILKESENFQILILVPEIMLTTNLLAYVKSLFSLDVVEWHSGLTPKNRFINWMSIISGEAKLIVGTRSAVFLPYANLQMIVIDEEHDSSYKQEDSNIYNARDMAVARGKMCDFLVVLSSATPSMETIKNVDEGKYKHTVLSNRFGKAVFPTVNLVNMKNNDSCIISEEVYKRIKSVLEDGKQVAIFINKRGYSPVNICKSCGYKLSCPNCSVHLNEHRNSGNKEFLLCHHCGYRTSIAKTCPECNEEGSMISYGVGIERVYEELISKISGYEIALLTSDTVGSKKSRDQIMNDIINNKINIILGTQIIAKGHTFPFLTLVCIVDGDLSFSSGGLRDAERSYQIFHQVSGRSGRKEDRGEVMIQAYSTDNVLIRSLLNYNRDEFYKNELESREVHNMPPFSRLAAIIISSRDQLKSEIFAQKIFRLFISKATDVIQVMGPCPAPIFLLRNNYRHRILIKSKKNFPIQKYIKSCIGTVKVPNNINLKIDIDPMSFL